VSKDATAPGVEVLDNGLTLVVAPATTAGVSTVAVHVGVGFRSEPVDRPGMAHLFEHLMFQGSRCVEPGGHFHRVEAVGGRVGGHTRHDYTELFDVVPSGALLDTVRLEADRLLGPRLDQRTIDTQVEVIRAEIAQQVLGVPYGGFPWLHLPGAMYDSPVNTHDGYGDVAALSRVDVDDCVAFFDAWYAPSRIVVTIEGDVGSTAEQDAVRAALSAVPARPPAEPVTVAEPAPTADRHLSVRAANVPAPVWAAGFRLPDPTARPDLYAACTALSMLLPTQFPELRLAVRCGWYGVPLDARSPDAWVVSTHPTLEASGAPLLALVRDLLGRWDARAPAPDVLTHAAARIRLRTYQDDQRLGHRARRLGAAQLLYDDPAIDDACDPSAALDRDLLGEAATYLAQQHAGTVLVSRPEG